MLELLPIQNICLLCEKPLNDANDSAEHIFPNAIGGWESVRGFICKPCNNEKGRTWDAELGRQFAWLSLVSGIKRDRGELPSVDIKTVSGKEYRLQSDGTMRPKDFAFKRDDSGDQIRISFTARTLQEARGKVKELKKRYPSLDEESALKQARMTSSYLNEPLIGALPEGGAEVGRSVIMSALAVALKYGISPHGCELVLPFLKHSELSSACYGWSFLCDAVIERRAGEINHCISLFGSPESRKLFAYVELFSYARWHIALSEQYDGEAIELTYAIDPSAGKKVDMKIDWKNPLKRIEEVLAGDGFDQENLLKAVEYVMDTVMARSSERNFNTSFRDAVEKAKREFGVQDVGPDHPVPAGFVEKIIEEMKPYIFNRLGHNYPTE